MPDLIFWSEVNRQWQRWYWERFIYSDSLPDELEQKEKLDAIAESRGLV